MGVWQQRKLGECLTLISGGTPSKARNDFWGGTIPWVSCKDMKVDRLYDSEDHLTELGAASGTRLVPANTTLIVVRGMILAKDFPVAFTKRTVAFNQDLKAVIPAHFVDSEFMFHWFRASSYEILGRADEAGHGTKRLQMDRLLAIPINVPPLGLQKRIAGILSAYDDLIENCQRRIHILETMARDLYREWFVHFRFPGHEGHPRVASPLGEIPQGWEVRKLGELADLRWGDTSTTKASYIEEGYPAYSAAGLDGKLGHFDFDHVGVVLSAIGAQCGRTWLARGKWSCIKNTIRFWSQTPAVSTEYLFVATKGQDFWPRRGAAQPFISQGDAEKKDILVADPAIMNRFSSFVSCTFQQIADLEKKIQNLRQTRDLLLPRLLSGQIDLEAAEP